MQNWGFISNKLEPRSFFSYSYRLCLLLFCCFTCLFKFKSLTYTDGPTDLNMKAAFINFHRVQPGVGVVMLVVGL